MALKKYSIAVRESADFSQVVSRCRNAGLTVSQALDGIGIVSGSVDESKIEVLRQIPGVASVDEDREVQAM